MLEQVSLKGHNKHRTDISTSVTLWQQNLSNSAALTVGVGFFGSNGKSSVGKLSPCHGQFVGSSLVGFG